MKDRPVVYLTFANDPEEPLYNLGDEQRRICDALDKLDDQGVIKVVHQPGATREDIRKAIDDYWDRLCIFHYAGHAGRELLRMEGGDAMSKGLAEALCQQSNLKLVFLNGCGTAPQVNELLANGVDAVIATSVAIKDDMAMNFAITFYQTLAKPNVSIIRAFKQAMSTVNTVGKDPTGAAYDVEIRERGVLLPFIKEEKKTEVPWGLYLAREVREYDEWSLNDPAPDEEPDTDEAPETKTINWAIILSVSDRLSKYNQQVRDEMLKKKRNISKLQRWMTDLMPLPIGEEIKRLFERGEDRGSSPMRKFSSKRLMQLYLTYRATMEFICFILLSQLWDELHQRPSMKIPEERQELIRRVLSLQEDTHLSYSYIDLIVTITDQFDEYDINYFLKELARLKDRLKSASGLPEVHGFMRDIYDGLKSKTISADEMPELCQRAERELAKLLKRNAFIVTYKLRTITKIEIEKKRHSEPKFKHYNIELNSAYSHRDTNYANPDEFEEKYTENASVVFLKEENNVLEAHLNLSPFIIDINALNGESLSRLCIFAYKSDKGYHYRYLSEPTQKYLIINENNHKKIFDEFNQIERDIRGVRQTNGSSDENIYAGFIVDDDDDDDDD